MANLLLESAFRTLSLRQSSLCRQCRCTLTSTATRQQTTSSTRALADQFQSSQPRSPFPRTTTSSPGVPALSARVPTPGVKTTADSPRASSATDTATNLLRQRNAIRDERLQQEALADLERGFNRADLEKSQARRFKVGEVYAPHDLTGVEMSKWQKPARRDKGRKKFDSVDQLNIDPREHYKNFSIMSEYMSEMGRIKHSRETGLRPKNQRKMAKAIRRAIGIGLMPGVHRHPELLRLEYNRRPQN